MKFGLGNKLAKVGEGGIVMYTNTCGFGRVTGKEGLISLLLIRYRPALGGSCGMAGTLPFNSPAFPYLALPYSTMIGVL